LPSSGSGTATDKPSPINDSNTSSRKGADSYSGAPGASGTVTSGTNGAATTASTDKSKVKAKKKQVARNDMRCDPSANPGQALPKDCLSKSDTGAAAVNSTQGQSGGASQ
jgi:hypothetical protein